MNKDNQRSNAAGVLLASLQQRSMDSVARLEAIAERLKAENPNLADRVDWIMDQAIARAQQMPQVLTTLYLLNTQDPPEIIEGEVIEVIDAEPKATDALEESNG